MCNRNMLFVFAFCFNSIVIGQNNSDTLLLKLTERHANSESKNIVKLLDTGALKDWFKIKTNGVFYPITVTNNEDTLFHFFLSYDMGVYSFYSSQLGIGVKVPLFPIDNVDDNLCSKPVDIYNYLLKEYTNTFIFAVRKKYTLRCRYEIVNKEQGVYKIYHEEIFQPTFEDKAKQTGLIIYTISTEMGSFETEIVKKFNEIWY